MWVLGPRRAEPANRQEQKRARAAGRIQEPHVGLAVIADLIQHVFGQPVGRVVFTQGMPQRLGKEIFVQRLEEVARGLGNSQVVVFGKVSCQLPYNAPDRFRAYVEEPIQRIGGGIGRL